MNRWVKKGFSLLLSAAMLAAGMPAAADTANAQEKEAAETVIYAAPTGSDTGSGTKADPASLKRAKALARQASEAADTDIQVRLEGGTYYLEETLTFTREDSGKNGHRIIWMAEDESDKPVISGGKELEGKWVLHDPERNIYKYEELDEDFVTRDLYVNGARAMLARSRSSVSGLQYSTSDAAYEGKAEGRLETLGLKGKIADTVRGFGDISQLEAVRNVRWRHFEVPVDKVEGDLVYMEQTAWRNTSTTERVHYDWNGASWRAYSGGVTYFQNAYAFLDEAGEFYLDNTRHVLYYIPRDGEDMESAQVVAPVLEKIMVAEGRDTDKITYPQPGREKGGIVNEKIKNITFENICFQHNTFLRPGTEDGYVGTQGGHTLTGPEAEGAFSDPWGSYAAPPHGAVYVNSGDSIVFRGCSFSKIGSTALAVTKGSRSCTVTKSSFEDLSGGAIYLGENKHTSDKAKDPHAKGPSYSTSGIVSPEIIPLEERELSYNNEISYNFVNDTGKQFSDTCAIWCGDESDLKVIHNTVQNVPYTGINVGWGWRETGRVSHMHDNYIAYNRIIDYMKKETDMHDGGGLYMINAMPGTVVEYNYFNRNGVDNAVYFDAGLDYATLRNNVMTNIEYKWVSANAVGLHRGMVAYNNYMQKGYGTTNGRPDYTFDGEYTILGDNYTYTKVLPVEAEEIVRNAGCDAPYEESSFENPLDGAEILYYNLAEGKQASQSSGKDAQKAADNNINTVSATDTQEDPWWQVDIGRIQKVKSLDIHSPQPLGEGWVLISENPFGERTVQELLEDASIVKTAFYGERSSFRTKVAEKCQGRYVRIVLTGTKAMKLQEVKVNLDMDSQYVPYLKDTEKTLNLAKARDVSYEIYTSGNPISGVILDGKELPKDAYEVQETVLTRNSFLSEEYLAEYLEKVGESNQWYAQLKKHLESIRDEPKQEKGAVLTLKKQYLVSHTSPGSCTVEVQFEKGMELTLGLTLYSKEPKTLAQYDFEETQTSQAVEDRSGNGNHLDINGGAKRVQESVNGQAIAFDGSGAARKKGCVSLDKLEKELQIDFFVKILPRAEGNAQLINKRAMGKTTGFMVDLTKTNVLRFTAGAGGNVINTLQPLSENKWYHVTCTYRNKKMQLYLNGELQSEKTLGSEAVLGNDLALSLGKHADDTEPFTGLLDEILIQDTVEDTTAPLVLDSQPEQGEMKAELSEKLSIYFSENVKMADNAAVRLTADGRTVGVSAKHNGRKLEIVPENGLRYGISYKLSIPAGTVADESGNELQNSFYLSFTTREGQGTPFIWDENLTYYRTQPADVEVSLSMQGRTLEKVMIGEEEADGSSWSCDKGKLILKKELLERSAGERAEFTLAFGDDISIPLTIHLSNAMPEMEVLSFDFAAAEDRVIRDLSGNSNDGIVNNPQAVQSQEGIGSLLNLNGTADNTVEVKDSPTLHSFESLCLDFWMKGPDQVEKTMTILSKKGMGQAGFGLELYADASLNFVIRHSKGGNSTVRTAPDTIKVGQEAEWQHIKAVFDNNIKEMKVYVDGELLKSAKAENVTFDTINNANASLAIGWAYQNGVNPESKYSFLTGQIANLHISNGVRDVESPQLVSVEPEDGKTGAALDTSVQAVFSKEIRIREEKEHTICLRSAAAKETVSTVVSAAGTRLTIKPVKKLAYGTVYEAVIPADAIEDSSKNTLDAGLKVSFTTLTGKPYITGAKEAEYDSENPAEITAGLVLSGNTIIEIRSKESILGKNDYALNGEKIVFSRSYLDGIKDSTELTFVFSNGYEDRFYIQVVKHETVAEYHLDGADGVVTDLTGYGNSGELNTGSAIVKDITMGDVLSFDGSPNSAIQIGNSDSLSSFRDLNIELWMKVPKKNAATQTIVHKKGMGAAGFALELQADQSLNFVIRKNGGNVNLKTEAGLITTGEEAKWHHVKAVYDRRAQTMTMTVDQTEKSVAAAGVTAATLNNTAINLNLGHSVNGTTADTEKASFYKGYLAYLALSNTAKDVTAPRILAADVAEGQVTGTESPVGMIVSETDVQVDDGKIALREEDGGADVEFTVQVTKNRVEIIPKGLKNGTAYQLSVKKGAFVDKAGNFSEHTFVRNFVTEKAAVDLEPLRKLYEEKKKITGEDYTEDTYEKLQDALNTAKEVLDKGEEAEQKEADQAYETLMTAADGLTLKKAEKGKLRELLEKEQDRDLTYYTKDSTEDYLTALETARTVESDETLTIRDQQRVEDAKTALEEAIRKLRVSEATREALRQKLEDAKGADESLFTEESVTALAQAAQKAEDLLNDPQLDQKTPEEIRETMETLEKALDSLVYRAADTKALEEELAKADSLEDADTYTEETVKALREAADQARELLKREGLNITHQAAVDDMTRQLKAALEGLEKTKEDPTPDKPDPEKPDDSKPDQPEPVMVKKVTITGESKKIAAGKKIGLKVKISPANATDPKVEWSSSNRRYASVDKNGKVTVKKAGAGKTAVITAKALDGSAKKASYKIKIMKRAVKKIRLTAKTKTVKAGRKLQITAKLAPSTKINRDMKWSVSNSKYAKVSRKGLLTTKKAGKGKRVTVTARALDGSGKKASIRIRIK